MSRSGVLPRLPVPPSTRGGGTGRDSVVRTSGLHTHSASCGGLVTPATADARPTGTAPRARRLRPSCSGHPSMSRVRSLACRVWAVGVEDGVPGLAAPTLSPPGRCPPPPACPSLRAGGPQEAHGPASGLTRPANAFPGLLSPWWPLQWLKQLEPNSRAARSSVLSHMEHPGLLWEGELPPRGRCGGLPASF